MPRMEAHSKSQRDFEEASRLLELRQFKRAVALFSRAARRGDPSSQLMLGYCFDKGTGVPRSRDWALHWYRRAAAKGDSAAAANIGTVFRDEEKRTLALRWYRKAVFLGLPEALLDIALLEGGPTANGKVARRSLQRLYSGALADEDLEAEIHRAGRVRERSHRDVVDPQRRQLRQALGGHSA